MLQFGYICKLSFARISPLDLGDFPSFAISNFPKAQFNLTVALDFSIVVSNPILNIQGLGLENQQRY